MATAFNIPYLPARLIPDQPWSDDDFFRFCQENHDLRVERSATGEIVLMSPGGSGTSRANAVIVAQLVSWSESTENGVVFESNGGFLLPDGSVLAADAAWMQNHRWEALTLKEQSRFAPACPDFVIELRSPSDSLPELQRKMTLWLANGAQLGWLIDPKARTVEIYRPDQGPELMRHPAEMRGEGWLAGFTLVMRSIWT